MSTLDTWKFLQENQYFENHRLYVWEPDAPKWVKLEDIRGKAIVEIGGGFGRQTAYFGKIARKVYMIEVSKTIIEKAKKFLDKHNVHNVELLLVDDYYEKIPFNIDYAYSYLVFQHITPMQTQEYIDAMYRKLAPCGKINFQFRLGEGAMYLPKLEPTVLYTVKDVRRMVNRFHILQETVKDEHIFIYASKPPQS